MSAVTIPDVSYGERVPSQIGHEATHLRSVQTGQSPSPDSTNRGESVA